VGCRVAFLAADAFFAIAKITVDAKSFICKYVDFLKISPYIPCWHVMHLDSSPIGVTA
jgi:hypothetical protein